MQMAQGDGQRDGDVDDDVRTLHAMGYAQELSRRMNAFSSLALSLSIICILSGGVTSFHLGLSAVGGASIGLGWPLACLFSLIVAATMAQLASAFPTAGGLYHWASLLGGRGWGWATAWFNLAGLVTVLAAINVGSYRFAVGALGPRLGLSAWWLEPAAQALGVALITASHAVINHMGIRATTRLTDFSGFLIVAVSTALAIALLTFAPSLDPTRLITFTNYSGPAGGNVWPASESLMLLFALGLLLPSYTVTGFDAPAHASEETKAAAAAVPRGIVRSVVISGLAGWVLLSAVVLAAPDLGEAAAQGEGAFLSIVDRVLPGPIALFLTVGIVMAQYLCGLATVTSASRMAFAFARDGGLPYSTAIRRVSPTHQTPAVAIWTVSIASVLFTVWTPIYSTITAVCVIFLYLSYVIPTALGLVAFGRSWTTMGPWNIGGWYRPLAALSVVGCLLLILIGMQPPNDRSVWVVGSSAVVLALAWLGSERRRFPGPPRIDAAGTLVTTEDSPFSAVEPEGERHGRRSAGSPGRR
ncbi:amino acid permease [Singulisphaera acidiphila]|uniref:Amino acid transporter n=1 Tax=Singulisphaera acidiphila (strain ATCC BAA-1392 / DSM 18658 / VKM B-2454 / MOB10) TaxID=886293 RepID=L0DL37_SINAD|nr:amino acid permease [Singulisphaera acidiphila]AGA29361.1 amino acid transporter [Singulisphaera acidiphila DSM 18658]